MTPTLVTISFSHYCEKARWALDRCGIAFEENALGATAAQTIFGPHFKVTESRGQVFATEYAPYTFATVHPSSVLRAPDAEARASARRALIADLERVAGHLRDSAVAPRHAQPGPAAGTKAARSH